MSLDSDSDDLTQQDDDSCNSNEAKIFESEHDH